jgi:hypothetical protein
MKCLDNIIGVTRESCECLLGEKTPEQVAALAKSVSGIYLDELDGALTLKAIKASSSTCQEMIALMEKSIEIAKRETMDGIIIEIQSRTKQNRDSYVGNVGEVSASMNLAASQAYLGQRWRSYNSDGVIKITGGYIYLNAAQTGTIRIIRAVQGTDILTEVLTFPYTSQANVLTALVIPNGEIKLPMMVGGEIVDYYIMYDRQGALPKNNSLTCNCGNKERILNNFLTREGVGTTDLTMLKGAATYGYAMGLSFNVDVRCDTGEFICREYSDDNAIAIAFAHAVRYRANWWLNEQVLKSDQINRYTMMNREYMWGKRNHFRSEWETRIQWIGANIDMSSTDCFICRDNQMAFGGIFA